MSSGTRTTSSQNQRVIVFACFVMQVCWFAIMEILNDIIKVFVHWMKNLFHHTPFGEQKFDFKITDKHKTYRGIVSRGK